MQNYPACKELRGSNTFVLCQNGLCFHCEKKYTLRGKILIPLEEFFPFRIDHFSEGA